VLDGETVRWKGAVGGVLALRTTWCVILPHSLATPVGADSGSQGHMDGSTRGDWPQPVLAWDWTEPSIWPDGDGIDPQRRSLARSQTYGKLAIAQEPTYRPPFKAPPGAVGVGTRRSSRPRVVARWRPLLVAPRRAWRRRPPHPLPAKTSPPRDDRENYRHPEREKIPFRPLLRHGAWTRKLLLPTLSRCTDLLSRSDVRRSRDTHLILLLTRLDHCCASL